MNEIIALNPNNSRFPVSARELYEKLGFDKTHWNRWSIKNIKNNPFAEMGRDYEGFALMANGNQTLDYSLTIDFSKRLCMMARTEMGETIRNYFLEVERRYKNQNELAIHKQVSDMAKEKRVEFTDILQAHGCTAKYHYINITKGMKERLNIDPKKKKRDCATLEVMAIACSENLAALGIMMSGSEGYYECRDVSYDAAGKVRQIAASGQLKLGLKAGV